MQCRDWFGGLIDEEVIDWNGTSLSSTNLLGRGHTGAASAWRTIEDQFMDKDRRVETEQLEGSIIQGDCS
jgi:hypothetical protein